MSNGYIAKRAALVDFERAAQTFNRDELYEAIHDIAEEIRKPGESVEQARVRAQATPEGERIMKAYRIAKSAPTMPQTFTKMVRPNGKASAIVEQIDEIARDIASKEGISSAQARVRAWQRNPDLKQKYDDARRADISQQAGER